MNDRGTRGWRAFAWGVAVVALWGGAAPYIGPALGFVVRTRAVVEVVDHVLPAIVVLAAAAVALTAGILSLPAALTGLLAAMWMAGTHVPLLLQVPRHEVAAGAALWHSLPGMVLFVGFAAAVVVVSTEPSVRR